MDEGKKNNDGLTRRQFLARAGRTVSAATGGVLFASLGMRAKDKPRLWQIDPFKCTQCGNCQTACVLDESAVKCVHDFPMCGYCELCFGFFKTNPVALNTGAENQMCPTGALMRKFVEDPYFQYVIDESLCIGCGKCVEGCGRFGNGSLYLQVRHDRCLNCNECAIAAQCPANAFIRVVADKPYVIKHKGPQGIEEMMRERTTGDA